MTMVDPTAIWTYRAAPIRAIDGDTVELLIDVGLDSRMQIHVRLYGVDALETNDPDPARRARAVEAQRFVQNWMLHAGPGKWPLWVKTHKDRRSFTRYIAEIWNARGESLADALREAGHAS